MENEHVKETEAEHRHREMSRAEQAQLLQWMAQDRADAEPWPQSEL